MSLNNDCSCYDFDRDQKPVSGEELKENIRTENKPAPKKKRKKKSKSFRQADQEQKSVNRPLLIERVCITSISSDTSTCLSVTFYEFLCVLSITFQ